MNRFLIVGPDHHSLEEHLARNYVVYTFRISYFILFIRAVRI